MKKRDLILLAVIVIGIWNLLSSCSTMSLSTDFQNSSLNKMNDTLPVDVSLTKDEALAIFQNIALKTRATFDSFGYDIQFNDAKIYALASVLVGDTKNAYRMLRCLGSTISKETLEVAENYDKAIEFLKNGEFKKAYMLLEKNGTFLNSKKICNELLAQNYVVYRVGDVGPAGGYIFYDKGSYSEGWRYLEVAPVDLDDSYKFGYYKTGSYSLYETVGTETAIGTGKANTENLVNMIGKGTYAAKACVDYSLNGYDDWFLPSKDELNLMYTNLHKKDLGSFVSKNYWSSSECDGLFAWRQDFSYDSYFNYGGQQYYVSRSDSYRVRAVRAF